MKREGYVLAAVIFGVLLYHHAKMKVMIEAMEVLRDATQRLLDESYQADVDNIFEDIVETHLDELDDLD